MAKKALYRFANFFHLESASSVLLFAAMLGALFWANSPLHASYHGLWHQRVFGISFGHWINDGLMAVFFFVVGLEIRREFSVGELSSPKKASFPIVAAIGGMVVPAIIYTAFNWHTPELSGWGITMATDIAFAVGVLSTLGKRIPTNLKVFLMALAIVDDLGAVLVIAIFYTQQISWFIFFFGLAVLALLKFFNRFSAIKTPLYLVAGIFVWLCFLKSGVHATIAGVLLAMVVPKSSIRALEHTLQPYVAFGILPLFALANAGVAFTGADIFHRVSLGIILGLVLGKQIGITLFSWVAVKLGFATLPAKIGWFHIYGVSCLAGIGFTMSIFIANLGLTETHTMDAAKIAIFVASFLSTLWGIVVLRKCNKVAIKNTSIAL